MIRLPDISSEEARLFLLRVTRCGMAGILLPTQMAFLPQNFVNYTNVCQSELNWIWLVDLEMQFWTLDYALIGKFFG